jgi:hypothetical protein
VLGNDQKDANGMNIGPRDSEDRLEHCDLAGIARVESVGRADSTAPKLAKLTFLEIVKGEPREGHVLVRLRGGRAIDEIGAAMWGAWSDWWDYPAGHFVMTHLVWSAREGVYRTAWPGAVWEVQAQRGSWEAAAHGPRAA